MIQPLKLLKITYWELNRLLWLIWENWRNIILYSSYEVVLRIPKLIIIAHEKTSLLEISTIAKFLLL